MIEATSMSLAPLIASAWLDMFILMPAICSAIWRGPLRNVFVLPIVLKAANLLVLLATISGKLANLPILALATLIRAILEVLALAILTRAILEVLAFAILTCAVFGVLALATLAALTVATLRVFRLAILRILPDFFSSAILKYFF